MPEQTTNSTAINQGFIELIMLHAQQAAISLGQSHHSNEKSNLNLPAAKMFIGHLEIIQEKTRGNLTKDEEKFLTNILSELHLSFVQVVNNADKSETHMHDENCQHQDLQNEVQSAPQKISESNPPNLQKTPSEGFIEKKRFSKSYGS